MDEERKTTKSHGVGVGVTAKFVLTKEVVSKFATPNKSQQPKQQTKCNHKDFSSGFGNCRVCAAVAHSRTIRANKKQADTPDKEVRATTPPPIKKGFRKPKSHIAPEMSTTAFHGSKIKDKVLSAEAEQWFMHFIKNVLHISPASIKEFAERLHAINLMLLDLNTIIPVNLANPLLINLCRTHLLNYKNLFTQYNRAILKKEAMQQADELSQAFAITLIKPDDLTTLEEAKKIISMIRQESFLATNEQEVANTELERLKQQYYLEFLANKESEYQHVITATNQRVAVLYSKVIAAIIAPTEKSESPGKMHCLHTAIYICNEAIQSAKQLQESNLVKNSYVALLLERKSSSEKKLALMEEEIARIHTAATYECVEELCMYEFEAQPPLLRLQLMQQALTALESKTRIEKSRAEGLATQAYIVTLSRRITILTNTLRSVVQSYEHRDLSKTLQTRLQELQAKRKGCHF